MPELPEIEAYRRRFSPRLEGRSIDSVEVNPRKGFILRSPLQIFTSELRGRRFAGVWRRGKHLIFDLEKDGDCAHLVVNPMLGGRFQWADAKTKQKAVTIFSLVLDNGEQLRYLDFKDMGRVYWARDLDKEVLAWPELGPEADSIPEQGLDWFRKRLRRYRAAMKDVLRDQAFLTGIGNAYSDEILWEARILPLRRRASLKPEDEETLFNVIPAVLTRATEIILANPNYEEAKQDRSFMSVHARGGEECPRCGHRISQIGSNREPMNFCRGCQF